MLQENPTPGPSVTSTQVSTWPMQATELKPALQLVLAIARADMGVLLLHDEAGGALRPFISHNMTDAQCATFIPLGTKGGLDVVAHVGACQRDDCTHNSALECTAPAVRVGAGHDLADCLTYDHR